MPFKEERRCLNRKKKRNKRNQITGVTGNNEREGFKGKGT
jgi:hypothetical protein